MTADDIFSGRPAALEEILVRRETRAAEQTAMLRLGGQSLISFTLNIPGEIKQFPLSRAAFEEGLSVLEQALPSNAALARHRTEAVTGYEALILLDLPPVEVKRVTVQLEETHPLGRLFDLDVLDHGGRLLSRSKLGRPPRQCLLCSRDARVCAREQLHSPDALRERIGQMLDAFFRDQAADLCVSCTTRALLYEVSATPKPGLVDRSNCGAHGDMDFYTFLDSSAALVPKFRELFCLGWNNAGTAPAALFPQLRAAGIRAESAMNTITGGINTHKGLIFSIGLVCAAYGQAAAKRVLSGRGGLIPLADVLASAAQLGQCTLSDFESESLPQTCGLSSYRTAGITGARGEAAAGFPTVTSVACPRLREWLGRGFPLNDAAAVTLLYLLCEVSDTNMIRRGGMEEAKARKAQAAALTQGLTARNFRARLRRLDQEYIREGLSPGGCADLLAVGLLLVFLEDAGCVTAASPLPLRPPLSAPEEP